MACVRASYIGFVHSPVLLSLQDTLTTASVVLNADLLCRMGVDATRATEWTYVTYLGTIQFDPLELTDLERQSLRVLIQVSGECIYVCSGVDFPLFSCPTSFTLDF